MLETSYGRPGHLVRRAYQISQAIFLDETSELGLTSVQYSALNAIAELPGIDQATLSGLIAFDKTTLVKVLDRLVTKGLITRVRSTEDRRRQVLTATDKGRKLLKDIIPMLDSAQKRILEPLTQEEQTVLLTLLSKLVQVNNSYSRAPLNPDLYAGVKSRVDAEKKLARAREAA